ncbi:hypothetical protein, partial [Leucobacter alluvii]|uniref:hypothetical protein n=1 Tax=Leucobacter alluvii TaxID=340321 RepID=UPI003D153CCE
ELHWTSPTGRRYVDRPPSRVRFAQTGPPVQPVQPVSPRSQDPPRNIERSDRDTPDRQPF